MRHLYNALYVLTEDSYLSLENDNVAVNLADGGSRKFPLRTLEQILYFGYKGASPALLGKCAEYGISLSFYTPNGRFLARISGRNEGNVLLRKEQYRVSDDEGRSCAIAKDFIVGKIYNSRSVLERGRRDHPLSLDTERVSADSAELLSAARRASSCGDLAMLRGIEGEAAGIYFAHFDDFILQSKDYFRFDGRNKRPPRDPVNALLSFTYTLLANDCASALESTGLDPYVGFLHRDRPGRMSLALDLMEEFRSIFADRFVLNLINNRAVNSGSFKIRENGSVLLKDDARKALLASWQERKKTVVQHPFLGEKVPWGLLPFVQAQLLARCLRGDLDRYPAFLRK